jgi:hypothetical protein
LRRRLGGRMRRGNDRHEAHEKLLLRRAKGNQPAGTVPLSGTTNGITANRQGL